MPGFVYDRSYPLLILSNGTAPFGVWKFTKTWVSSDWSQNPTVPSAQDFGILSLADREIRGSGTHPCSFALP